MLKIIFKHCTAYVVFLGLAAGGANAVTIAPNSNYDVTGTLGLVAIVTSSNVHQYTFNMTFRNATLTTGLQTGGRLDAVTLLSDLDVNILDATNTQVGTATGQLNLKYTDVTRGNNLGAAYTPESGGAGLLTGNFRISGSDFNVVAGLGPKVLNPTGSEDWYQHYNFADALRPNDAFSMVFGNSGLLSTDSIHAWLMTGSPAVINGVQYTLVGDIHGHLSGGAEIPEPASMTLLAIGGLGAAYSRRRRAQAC